MTAGPPEVPGVGAGVLAIIATAVAASLAIAAVLALQLWPFVLVVTLAIAATAGLPLFAVLRRVRRHRLIAVAVSGFATGGIAPVLLALSGPGGDYASVGHTVTVANGSYTAAGWAQMLGLVAGFGLLGAAGALAAWRLSLWLSAPAVGRSRSAIVAMSTVAASICAFAVPWLDVDRSCHNPLRGGGRSIAPVAAFELAIPERDWPAVDDELRRFAQRRRWDVQVATQPATGFPWYQQSLCTEPGTQISVMNAGGASSLFVSAFQPQGGDSWQPPLREVQWQLEARWPGSTRYRYDEHAAPRPPWAPPAPTPAPSATVR